jgi:Kinesin motor domain
MEASQQQVYDTVVGDKILSDVFRGINFTIIAYGQTCSGKSHTMQGFHDGNHLNSPQNSGESSEITCPTYGHPGFDISENDGIIPRAIHDLFQGKMKFRSKGAVSIEMTYCEVYNDDIRDLLHTTDFQNLKILDQGDAGVFLEGLQSVPIESAAEAYELMNYAAERRATASTYLNIQSSRSHAICTLTVSIRPLEKSRRAEVTQAKLTLVDLAGSERIKKSGVVGIQQQESITINKDLFVLGKVVAALSDQSRSSTKEKHVAYRDSKLTRLLRESLGGKNTYLLCLRSSVSFLTFNPGLCDIGNCFTVMISCVSPTDVDIEESINTLRYAERARSISNTIKRNVSQALLSPAQCEALTMENMRLKALVAKLQQRVKAEISRDTAGSLLDQEEEIFTPIANPPKEIFRLDSDSTSSSLSPSNGENIPEEKRPRKPVWLHFQDLAKITKNVSSCLSVFAVLWKSGDLIYCSPIVSSGKHSHGCASCRSVTGCTSQRN